MSEQRSTEVKRRVGTAETGPHSLKIWTNRYLIYSRGIKEAFEKQYGVFVNNSTRRATFLRHSGETKCRQRRDSHVQISNCTQIKQQNIELPWLQSGCRTVQPECARFPSFCVCELNKLLNTKLYFLLRTHHVLSWLLEE